MLGSRRPPSFPQFAGKLGIPKGLSHPVTDQMSLSRRCASFCVAAAVALLAALMFVGSAAQTAARADPLGQLNSQLGAEQARQSHLNATIGNLSSLISGLDGQIRLVENRLAGVQEELAADRAQLARVTTELKQERALVVKLRRRLAFARMVLSRQLVSSYEGDQPDLVSVVLNANGFNNLLDQITFLKAAETQQQTAISITRADKLAADDAAARLAKLETKDRGITHAATVQARALASMNALLQSKQSALARARSAQELALQASQERANALQSRISQHSCRPGRGGRGGRGRGGGRRRPRSGVRRLRHRSGPNRRLGDPVGDRALRVGRPEPAAQQRRRVGLLPDHPLHLEAVRRDRARRLPDQQGRAGRGRLEDLERWRRRLELGLRRDRRNPLTKRSSIANRTRDRGR